MSSENRRKFRRKLSQIRTRRAMMLETLEPREMLAITAGAGPGGVIPEGPASDVVLWVKADTLGLADGANVDAWADQSGRGNDLGNRQNTVTYIAADPDFNSQPSVQFGNGIAGDGGAGNATRGWLESPALLTNGTQAETMWVLNTPHHTNTNDGQHSGGFMRIGSNSNHHYSWGNRQVYENFSRSGRPGFNVNSDSAAPHIYNVSGDDDGQWRMFVNGNNLNSTGTENPTYHGSPWSYGRSNHTNNNNGDWDGSVPEIFITNRPLDDAERLVVQNYLHSKYGIANTLTDDMFAGDTAGNGEHDFDLFGVARTQGDSVIDAGAGGFGIEVASLAADGDALLAAHDGGAGKTMVGAPAGTEARLNRTWYVDSSGSPGNATLTFDYSDAGATLTTESAFFLLQSNDGVSWNVLDSHVTADPEVNGDTITFNNVALSDGWYTLGDASTLPLVGLDSSNLVYNLSDPATVIDPALSANDLDSANWTDASVEITANFNAADDVLAWNAGVASANGITVTPAGGNQLNLAGNVAFGNYENVLRTVTYQNTGTTAISQREITFTATDTESNVGSGTRSIDFTSTGIAISHVWDGSESDDWNVAGNWATDAVPDADDIAIFQDAGTSDVDLDGAITVGELRLENTAGNDFVFSNGSFAVDTITQTGAGTNTIDVLVSSGAFAGTVSDGQLELTILGNATVGTWTVSGGTLAITGDDTSNALGSTAVTLSGGNLEVRNNEGALGGVFNELELWLDASDIDGDGNTDAFTDGQEFGTGGGQINGWQDKSGNDRDFDGMRNTPTYVTSSTHDQPAVHFDGTQNELMWMNAGHNPRTFIDGNGEFTLISVARYAAAGERERVISARTGHNWLFGFHGNRTNRGGHYDGWGSLDAPPVGGVTDDDWHLHSNRMNVFGDATNPFGVWYRDGVELDQRGDGRGTGNSFNNNVPDGLALGGWDINNGNREDSTSEVSELIMYNRVLSVPELLAVESYLSSKYGLGGASAAGVDLTANAITVTADSSITMAEFTNVDLGDVTIADNVTLTVDSLDGEQTATVTGTTALGATNATINTTNDAIATFNAVTGDPTITKTGDGTLELLESLPGRTSPTIVNEGTLSAGTNGVIDSALGTGDVDLNAGVLNLIADPTSETLTPGIQHFGYHVNSDAATLNLDGNGGMVNGGNPAGFGAFFGQTILTDGPGGRGLDFNNDGDFNASGAIGQNDSFSNLFLTTLTVPAGQGGNWNFRINFHDDPVGIWIDLDQDGIFESARGDLSDNNGEFIAWNGGCCAQRDLKTVALSPGEYKMAFTHREGGGGSQIDITFASPSITERTIKPTDPAQAGLWSYSGFANPVIPNAINVNGDAEISLDGQLSNAELSGTTTVAANTEITLSGGSSDQTFEVSGTFDMTGDATVNTAGTIEATLSGTVGFVNAAAITKDGDGTLIVESYLTTHSGDTNVNGGNLRGPTTANTPFVGTGDINLGGGALELQGDDAPNSTSDAMWHFGYIRGSGGEDQGQMDLDGNDAVSMMSNGNPTSHPRILGSTTLTDGPGGRGLNFDNDADFVNSGAIVGRNDNYTNMWLSVLDVSAANAGDWEFRYSDIDDWRGMWLDLDQDGVFESTTAGLGSNRGEQLAWQDGGTKTVNLAAGQYLFAATHLEGGGGSRAEVQFRSPTMGAQAVINPSDPAQAGIWNITSLASTLPNAVSVSGDSGIRKLAIQGYFRVAIDVDGVGNDWIGETRIAP